MFTFTYHDVSEPETIVTVTSEEDQLSIVAAAVRTFLSHVYGYVDTVVVTTDKGMEFSSND